MATETGLHLPKRLSNDNVVDIYKFLEDERRPWHAHLYESAIISGYYSGGIASVVGGKYLWPLTLATLGPVLFVPIFSATYFGYSSDRGIDDILRDTPFGNGGLPQQMPCAQGEIQLSVQRDDFGGGVCYSGLNLHYTFKASQLDHCGMSAKKSLVKANDPDPIQSLVEMRFAPASTDIACYFLRDNALPLFEKKIKELSGCAPTRCAPQWVHNNLADALANGEDTMRFHVNFRRPPDE